MTIYSVNYQWPYDEKVTCGLFDDYHLANAQMELLKESFVRVATRKPQVFIEEYELNDDSLIEEAIQCNKKYNKFATS
jgi:hypothetical protein